jgi:hypothetical protein
MGGRHTTAASASIPFSELGTAAACSGPCLAWLLLRRPVLATQRAAYLTVVAHASPFAHTPRKNVTTVFPNGPWHHRRTNNRREAVKGRELGACRPICLPRPHTCPVNVAATRLLLRSRPLRVPHIPAMPGGSVWEIRSPMTRLEASPTTLAFNPSLHNQCTGGPRVGPRVVLQSQSRQARVVRRIPLNQRVLPRSAKPA